MQLSPFTAGLFFIPTSASLAFFGPIQRLVLRPVRGPAPLVGGPARRRWGS